MSKEFNKGPEEIAEAPVAQSLDREKEFSIQFEDPDFDFLFAEEKAS